MKNNTLTAIVLTKNEEVNIKKCLNSLSFCEEMIVIDDFSVDNTIKVAQKLGAKVFRRRLQSNFAAQRNFGLKKARSVWVLFIDADEVVSPQLAREILRKIKTKTKYDGFFIKRDLTFFGKKISHGEIGETRLVRFGRKNHGSWKRSVHEKWGINGKIGELSNPINHNQSKSVTDLVNDIKIYSKIHAWENIKEKKQPNFLPTIFYPIGKFFVFYVLKRGFLDGVHGFILTVLMSYHSFLSWSEAYLTRYEE